MLAQLLTSWDVKSLSAKVWLLLFLCSSSWVLGSPYSSSISENNPFLQQTTQKSHNSDDSVVSKIELPVDESLFVDQLTVFPANGRNHYQPLEPSSPSSLFSDLNPLKQGVFFPTTASKTTTTTTTTAVVMDHSVSLSAEAEGAVSASWQQQRIRKTGTTIAGMVGRDFCIVAADTRATMGTTVADQRAEKLHFLCGQVWAAGAGTSADLQHLARTCRYTFRHQPDIGNPSYYDSSSSTLRTTTTATATTTATLPSFQAVCHWIREQLYQEGGSCQANFIVGGICPKTKRPYLRAIHPHGSMDSVAFAALGSGGMAAMAVLESSYTTSPELTCEQAVSILLRAIQAGIENDLGSGSQVDLVILHSNGTTKYKRAAVPEAQLPVLEDTIHDGIRRDGGGGVNGFGNTPFVLKPALQEYPWTTKRPEDVEYEWSAFLGLL